MTELLSPNASLLEPPDEDAPVDGAVESDVVVASSGGELETDQEALQLTSCLCVQGPRTEWPPGQSELPGVRPIHEIVCRAARGRGLWLGGSFLGTEEYPGILEHLSGMGADDHLGVPHDHAGLGIQEYCQPPGDGHRAGGPGGLGQGARGVGPDLEVEAHLLGPESVDLGAGVAHAHDPDAQGVEVGLEVAEPATLECSTGGPDQREEPHRGGVATEVLQGAGCVVLGPGAELGDRDGRSEALTVKSVHVVDLDRGGVPRGTARAMK